MLKKNLILYITTGGFLILLLVFNIVNYTQLSRLNKQQAESTNILLSESSANRKTDDYLNNMSSMLAYDLSRTRASLGLPMSDYPFKNITDTGPVSPVFEKNNELIDAITVLIQAEADNKKSAMLGRFFRNKLIDDFIEGADAELEKADNLTFELKYDDQVFVKASAVSETGIFLQGFNGEELNVTSASNEVVFFINNNLKMIKELQLAARTLEVELTEITKDPEVLEVSGNDIYSISRDDSILFLNKYNSKTIKVWTTVVDNTAVFKISGLADNFNTYEKFKSHLIEEVTNFDLRTDDIALLDNAKSELEIKFNNEEFRDHLKSMELKISSTPREDLDYIYYDINHENGQRLGSFSILKKIGEIYLVDADEVPVSALRTLSIKNEISKRSTKKMVIPENIPQIDNLYSSQDSVTFLIVGNHELNTDTMILAHANKITGEAFMIGIPRDLYWKGRKINSIYLNYGAEQFKKELSDITGLDITNYIIVDMYAFIDIVNILGGIEVTLEEDLIDPTYKIRENGEWSTLNYSKGSYNLNGVEALRIARSRHGSNDFDRSKRQQQLLEAFLNKILALKISDVDKVYNMMQALFEYIDTDFSLVEMMSLFNNYSDVQLTGKHVLSFDNILYDTYSNIYMLDDKDIEFDENFNKGAWILFPRDNDWNNIRWYVRQIINGEI